MKMRTSCITSLLIFYLSFHLFSVKSQVSVTPPGGDAIGVPAFDISQKSLIQYLQLGDITIDLPALYVFGDSILDAGNNKFLNTPTARNYTPYGIDFNGGKPTGRATNGRTMADFLAQLSGLPFPPAYLAMSETEKKNTRTGANYASGSSGILPGTGLGDILSLDEQIDLFNSTVENLRSQFNSSGSFAHYLSKSLLFINTGTNDLGLAYDEDLKNTFTVPQLVQKLSEQFPKQLERLYKLGARKFLVNNGFPLGCTPFVLDLKKMGTTCEDEHNTRVLEYNKKLADVLTQLQSQLPESKFVLGDYYNVFMEVLQAPTSYGITNTRDPCMIGNATINKVCDDRNQYVFFDNVHPTEAIYFLITKRYLKEPSLCTPVSLIQLMQA